MTRSRARHPSTIGATSTGSALLCGLALAGCGASGNDVDPGYPPANPRPQRAAVLLPLLSDQRLLISVPRGWGTARLSGSSSAGQALVRLIAPCYESISITGSSIQEASKAQIEARYGRPVQGYGWTLSRTGGVLVALLGQYTSRGSAPSRSTVGTAYLPLDAHRQLAVDFGAGVWPLRRGPCSQSRIASLIAPLRATVGQVFTEAHVLAAGSDPSAPGDST